MDYFKHYSTASNSKTINLIIDEFGLEGYAYWFLLLELCAENFDGISAPNFKFHVRIVRQKLRISLAKLELFLTFCAGISEVSFNFHGNLLEIGHPNLLKVKTTRKLTKNNKKELVVYIDKDIDIDIDKEVINIKTKKDKSADAEFENIAFSVIEYLNKKTGAKFENSKSSMQPIIARLKSGHDVNILHRVIDSKCDEWLFDAKMKKYLRPSTLFNETKFGEYMAQIDMPDTNPEAEIGLALSNLTKQMFEERDSKGV